MAILTLAEAKLELNKTTTIDDTELQSVVDALDAVIEDYIRGPVVPVAVTERIRPMGSTILLASAPLISVTSLVAWDGLVPTTYTEAADPSAAGAATFLIEDAKAGIVVRLGTDGRTCPFRGQRVAITYQAGYAATPPAINQAARKIVAHLWSSQRGPRAANPIAGAAGRPVAPYSPLVGLKIPPDAEVLLEPFRKGGGWA